MIKSRREKFYKKSSDDDSKVIKQDTKLGFSCGLPFEKLCAFRCLSFLLIAALSNAERIEMECGFIERTDRGLQCEFNNIFSFESTEVVVIESNRFGEISSLKVLKHETEIRISSTI